MIPRALEQVVIRYAQEYPVLAVVGPRQSGKTTLVRKLFPRHRYISLENLDLRQQAEDDPRGFLDDHPAPVILDEVQRVPQLFSYLQERVDTHPASAQYILTGSHQFLLMEKISQSLAGRIATFRLYPFTLAELAGQGPDTSLESIFDPPQRTRPPADLGLDALVLSGFYPPIHARRLTPRKWLENYLQTYVERDIRLLVNVSNLRTFENFLKLCAAHSGQLLNYAAIANAVGVSLPTVKKWVSLLETSGIVFLLPPHHRNFSKRVVKTPKLYFVDTGLLCFLLSIRQPRELTGHPLKGHIFETLVVSEYYKRIAHLGEIPPLYFWRDKTGNEIDLIADLGAELLPIEIKSAQTFSPAFRDGLSRWFALKGNTATSGLIIYAGDQLVGQRAAIRALPWWAF